jgi:hypothetical protein
MKAQYTQGPWYVVKTNREVETGIKEGLLIKPIPGQVVAQLDLTPEMEANANLIATAPEMLEMLELIAGDLNIVKMLWSDKRAELRRIIAKAKGDLL